MSKNLETKWWRVSTRLQSTEYQVISAMSEDTQVAASVFIRGLIRLGLHAYHGQSLETLPKEDLADLIQLGVTQAPFVRPSK